MTTEPPACGACMDWALENCPGLKRGRPKDVSNALLPADSLDRMIQMIDPSRAPVPEPFNSKLDGGDDTAERERLGVIARKHGGLVGYVEFALPAGTIWQPDDVTTA